MKLNFIVGFRLHEKSTLNGRIAELDVPSLRSVKGANKEEIFLYFCGQIAQMCRGCVFYKDIQVMASFLERPKRIKFMIRFPNNSCAVLEALTNPLDIREKAKELKDYFEIAKKYNKTEMKLQYPVLLFVNFEVDASVIEKEYDIMILESTNAINFFKQIATNGQSN